MKTLQELYKELAASADLRSACSQAIKAGKVPEFIKEHGCDATDEEVRAFLMDPPSGELSDDELDSVAGGGCLDRPCPYCGDPVSPGCDDYGYHPHCRTLWLMGK